MKDPFVRSKHSNSGRSRAARPVLEGLEDRILLYATSGDHFTYGSRITWSIMPDGTSLGGANSNLVSTLNNRFGNNGWQQAIQDAFAVWENVANVNFSQVSDNGSALDSGSLQQGSTTIGDIRIGAFAQSSGILGFDLLPPPANGGSDSGDILLNSNQPWQINGDYDLESVMIHEIGHALGMAHSTDSNAIMYPYYQGVHQYVNSDDVAGVDSIWSARQEDGFAQGNANFNPSHAANVTSFINNLSQDILGPLNVASSSESYWFKVTTPSVASSTFSVVVQSSNLSELSPKLQIYNASLQGLAQTSAATNAYGAVIGASVTNSAPNTTYYIKVSASNNGANGSGAYGLLINMGNTNPNLVGVPNTVVSTQADQGGGGSYEHLNANIDPGGTSSVDVSGSPINWKTEFQGLGQPVVASQVNLGVQSLASINNGSATQKILNNEAAWEGGPNLNNHATETVLAATDTPDQLTLGDVTYSGDFMTIGPDVRTSSSPSPAPVAVQSVALIPIIPPAPVEDLTSVTGKRAGPKVQVSLAVPAGVR